MSITNPDYICENCRGDSFRFDGQHMICKDCGTILIREVESEADRRARIREEIKEQERLAKERQKYEKWLKSLAGHYERMHGFDNAFEKNKKPRVKWSAGDAKIYE